MRPSNGPQMAQITPELPQKAPPKYCVLLANATEYNFGVFGPFLARKRDEIKPKIASLTCFWASKQTKICPELPQNDSQTPPTVLYSCG